ncbi:MULTISPECIES: UbiX family flavin prenyltransferase [Desulfococcus]|jgi:4-hydroxy-3-polyprenylbenzoate decarboxylase|uniref:Flavin prenyltransferase UbiX n=1 Tax=Desulfococcus multivorans DSM 2059 TaxID=1121405 RepID=S7U5I5_DESML|nr:UbiX family flavin prenyltransferase [Desulfococcus multivorans]AOY60206.1 UbiX: 3-octaprenyl-4-hydroxybenzoate carboxylyase [Desulfococcus multivorans]AQV02328.1 aromatic acid decarboxylase [Desulfococcus multivorans]EPR44597.1 3-octaprenyl-4-hydroxybenzoate carboxy-lyase [Desulfococcus multivorans DSM 2059]SKA06791.1 4-hydroxy-3-polyprenylbenzoate decarboxylase [Desulfococcus multivorans DSM 2059]
MKKTEKKKTLVTAICGASGVIYGIRLLKALLARPVEVYLVISSAGYAVLRHEAGYDGEPFDDFLKREGVVFHWEARLYHHDEGDLFAPPASGSFRHDGMVVAPCSMKTLGAVASGIADGLIHRAADVCLKERRPLVLLTRETPLNLVHLENMRRAAMAGAIIMPPCPGFYTRPETLTDIVDGTVARVLDQLDIDNDLTKRWGDKDLV